MVTILSQGSRTPGFLAAAIVVSLPLLRYVKFVKIPIEWVAVLIFIFSWILFVVPIVGRVAYPLKPILSLFLVSFFLIFVFFIEVWLERCDSYRLYCLVKIIYGVFFIIGWFNYFFDINLLGYRNDNVFPFPEPAPFARIAGPIYVATFFLVSKKFKLIILANALLQAILLQSLSLLLYSVIIFIIVLQVRVIRFLIPIVFIISIVAMFLIKNPIYSKHFTSRFTLSSQSGNLTSLVYLQGVVAARDSLVNTDGLGLGFQMLGTEKPNEVSKIISSIVSDGGEVCRPEGGFLAAKLIAELGLVGVILTGFVFVRILRSLIWLRRYWRFALCSKANWSNYKLKLVIVNSLIVTFFIEMFLRGGEYFSLTVILFIVSVVYIRKYNKYYNAINESNFKYEQCS